ncbi:mandelate racemase/muconate lactonizing enzyme family protein [Desulfovibrio sp. UIB00]|uniref:mandelate racemase/muconate lactonizing enzyme family protein n=1 Tax=Desulfovibrio sp. UIB00 TaxID=2804314 RepID=UPI001F0EFE96|nr:mandelate racemase/muconate lactonizing enzyme family protein [Desulfovibrio sp. UIB00]MCH5143704.1 mandelate racemase/muconate lactonizing enzyme family protein [Desulfovibrio sp. UIB00]
MKITKIDIVILDTPNNPPLWRPVLCRVYTDNGLYGDGEAALAYGRGAYAAFGMIRELAPLLIGKNPLDNEPIWETLYKSTFWGQNGGAVAFAGISALDVALWDIKGKYYKEPVYRLLGGKRREKLRCYASQLQFGWDEDGKKAAVSPDDYARYAKKAVGDGYDAIKIDFYAFDDKGNRTNSEQTTRLQPPHVMRMLRDRISAVREAIGPDVDLIMENHSYTDVQSAIQIGNMAKEYGILIFEEPCTPEPSLNKYVHDNLGIPIAQGERIYGRWGFAPYFHNASIQMIQPDIGNCGGITEAKKICDMAHTYDVGVQVHVCSSPLLTAASLHLEAVIPNFTIHEHHVYNLHGYNKRLCKYDYQPVNGMFSVPELPGLGNELTPCVFEEGTLVTVE